ncbi:hypothetical protein Gpo141_00002760 [Globisporangium polare]
MGRTKPSATRKRAGTSYIQPAAAVTVGVSTRMAASALAFSLDASPVAAAATVTTTGPSSCAQRLSFRLDLRDTAAIPELSDIEPPQIESECMVDVSMAVEAAEEAVKAATTEAAPESTELATEEEAVPANAFQEPQSEDESIADTLSFGGSGAETSPSTAETENDDAMLPAAALAASSPPFGLQSPPLAASPLPQRGTQQQSAPSPIATAAPPIETPPAAAATAPAPRPPPTQERMVTISVAELERWEQRVVSHIEAHFSNEQLKRIAEFGRAHANLLVEAKEYVYNLETQLSAQFDKERADIRAQAEAFVVQAQLENQRLVRTIAELRHEIELLRLPSRRNRILVADDDDTDSVEVAANVAIESDSSSSSSSSAGSSAGSPDFEVVAVSRKQVQRHGTRDGRREKDKRVLHLGDGGDDRRKLKSNKTRRRAISGRVSVSSMAVDQVGEAG